MQASKQASAYTNMHIVKKTQLADDMCAVVHLYEIERSHFYGQTEFVHSQLSQTRRWNGWIVNIFIKIYVHMAGISNL